jgi:hypothetical protein
MTRDHFAKEMQSPNFAQYYEKTPAAKIEKRIEKFFDKIKKRIKFWKE